MSEEVGKFAAWYDGGLAAHLADECGRAGIPLNRELFLQEIETALRPLALKGRISLIAARLNAALECDYPEFLERFETTLGPPHPTEFGVYDAGYRLYPISQFVESFGLDHPEPSYRFIEAMTQRFTGEFAIRPFALKNPERTLEVARGWAAHPNFHVRRLASEGLRPRLPWASRLTWPREHATSAMKLAAGLRDDESLYVRRSAANHLNDWWREDPAVLMAEIGSWPDGESPQACWTACHALRTGVKAARPDALEIAARFQSRKKRSLAK